MNVNPITDCKFCEFPTLDPSVYDAPEVVKSHAIHLLQNMEPTDSEWDARIKRAVQFA